MYFHRIHFFTVSVLIFACAACYVSAYLMLVERQPVFYGNRLVQFPFILDTDGTWTVGDRIPPTPDAYRAAYRIKKDWIELLFKPVHRLDATLRSSYWPLPDPARISC